MNTLHSKILIIGLLLQSLFISALYSQDLTQTFRGRVIDAYTELPLPGATVLIVGSDPLIGTSAGANGDFRIDRLPLGRIDVQVSMIGYQPAVLNNLLLRSGCELVIEIPLTEQVYTINEVVVRPDIRKDQSTNEMAVVSARSFTIDETERYAGSLGDPSRMLNINHLTNSDFYTGAFPAEYGNALAGAFDIRTVNSER